MIPDAQHDFGGDQSPGQNRKRCTAREFKAFKILDMKTLNIIVNGFGLKTATVARGSAIFMLAASALLMCFAGRSAEAAFSPVSISIMPPVQFPPSDFNITGARVSALYGSQRDIYGLDLGLIGNITNGNFVGLAVSGIFNYTKGDTSVLGLQFAGLANINTNKTRVVGLQLAALFNHNKAVANIIGLQAALVNEAPHSNIYGVQMGLYNKADSVWGFQFGLVNVCNNLHGIQVGLVNFHHQGLFAVSPVLNIGF
jgi:hypothetical protein